MKLSTNTNQRKFWDNWHDLSKDNETLTTDNPERFAGRYTNATIVTLLRHIKIDELADYTVLDYGCGTGRLAKFIAPLCKRIILADISPKMLQTAKTRMSMYPNVEYMLVDPEHPFPLGVDAVDFCFSYAALGYFGAEDNFWVTIAEIDRVSRQFCLQLHSLTNESPETTLTIDYSAEQDIHSISCYRPSEKTIKQHYPDAPYLVERHEPDIRGVDMFFYKLDRDPISVYLQYGLPAEANYISAHFSPNSKIYRSRFAHFYGDITSRIYHALPTTMRPIVKKILKPFVHR